MSPEMMYCAFCGRSAKPPPATASAAPSVVTAAGWLEGCSAGASRRSHGAQAAKSRAAIKNAMPRTWNNPRISCFVGTITAESLGCSAIYSNLYFCTDR